MPIKHQSSCYRNVRGIRYTNHADLIYGDEENARVVAEARKTFKKVLLVWHWSKEYKQVFVSNE